MLGKKDFLVWNWSGKVVTPVTRLFHRTHLRTLYRSHVEFLLTNCQLFSDHHSAPTKWCHDVFVSGHRRWNRGFCGGLSVHMRCAWYWSNTYIWCLTNNKSSQIMEHVVSTSLFQAPTNKEQQFSKMEHETPVNIVYIPISVWDFLKDLFCCFLPPLPVLR